MKKAFVIALNILILIGCQPKNKKELKTDEKIIIKKNRTETKFFGDSLKVVYQYLGDTIIQNRIDLKGRSDDNFDSSFRVVSVWSTRLTSVLKCSEVLELTLNGIDFRYCYTEVFNKIDRDIKKAKEEEEEEFWNADRLNKTKKVLLKYKSNGQGDLSIIKKYFLFTLLREIEFNAYDNQTKSKVQKIRIEKYETSFSGGRNYYLINKTNDTIAIFYRNEWMK